jgi:DNA-binding LacI/PurR family transcriptional regulator
VSVSTVSRALRLPDLVSVGTRERVVAAAAELGYQPDPTAQGLRLGRTQTLGLLVPDLGNPFFATITKAVHTTARQAGYAVVVADTDEDEQAELNLVATLKARTDGLVLASPRLPDAVLIGAIEGSPTVVTNRHVPGIPSLTADDANGAGQALSHLHALGHRHIALAWGPASSYSGSRRLAGLRARAETYGDVQLDELGTFTPSYAGGFQAGDHVVASSATAVIAFNDLMALGILKRLGERGVRVPDDVSLVGCDDVVTASIVTPALTTIHIPQDRLGSRAVDRLIGLLRGTDTAEPATVLPGQLVIRASTGVR